MDIGSRVRLATGAVFAAPEIHRRSLPERATFEAFADSMPAAYRNVFDEASMRAHAAIVRRRGRAPARVEGWKDLPGGIVAICVAAADVVDLNTRVCAAVFAHGADVVGAQVYRRARSDLATEAVGFFWVRRAPDAGGSPGPVSAQDLARIGRTLEALVRRTDGLRLAARLSRAARAAGRSTVIDFRRGERGGTALTVRTEDRRGLLLHVASALFGEGLWVRSSKVRTQGRRATARFWVAQMDDKRSLGAEEEVEALIAVLEAIAARTRAGGARAPREI